MELGIENGGETTYHSEVLGLVLLIEVVGEYIGHVCDEMCVLAVLAGVLSLCKYLVLTCCV